MMKEKKTFRDNPTPTPPQKGGARYISYLFRIPNIKQYKVRPSPEGEGLGWGETNTLLLLVIHSFFKQYAEPYQIKKN